MTTHIGGGYTYSIMKQKTMLLGLVILGIVVGGVIGYKFKTTVKTENQGAVALSEVYKQNWVDSGNKDDYQPFPKSLLCNTTNEKGASEEGMITEDGSCLSFNNIPLDSEELTTKIKELAIGLPAIGGGTTTSEPEAKKICYTQTIAIVDPNTGQVGTSIEVRICHHRFLGIYWTTISY